VVVMHGRLLAFVYSVNNQNLSYQNHLSFPLPLLQPTLSSPFRIPSLSHSFPSHPLFCPSSHFILFLSFHSHSHSHIFLAIQSLFSNPFLFLTRSSHVYMFFSLTLLLLFFEYAYFFMVLFLCIFFGSWFELLLELLFELFDLFEVI